MPKFLIKILERILNTHMAHNHSFIIKSNRSKVILLSFNFSSNMKELSIFIILFNPVNSRLAMPLSIDLSQKSIVVTSKYGKSITINII